MHLVAGLGNPGSAYHGTRHNVGFQAVDYLAEAHHASFSESRWQAQVAKSSLGGEGVIFVKPQTFMNESGRAVGAISTYYRIPPENIIVIHDDLDLALGRIKVVANRGSGGHNGVISIISHLHSNSFIRIRMGIGRPDPIVPTKNFVLARFNNDEQAVIDAEVAVINKAIQLIISDGILSAMSTINSNKTP